MVMVGKSIIKLGMIKTQHSPDAVFVYDESQTAMKYDSLQPNELR